ncbi:MAG: putative phosphoribosyl transferase [Chlamydiae bacterium]|nr:putative phosphoribosyl transferase [Chlamydiota bacterium]
MYFKDRTDAGRQLAEHLLNYEKVPDGIVIGLPRGGVVLAVEVAKRLDLPLDVVCPRKIGAPMNPEFAIGAITETGEGIFNKEAIDYLAVSDEYIKETVEYEKQQAQRRLILYRPGMPPRDLKDKVVIIVDDGLATGSTMKAAIKSIKAEGAKQIVAAIPVSPTDTYAEIREMVDDTVCLSTPPMFQAVGQFYEQFMSTQDDDVVEIMSEYNQ